MIINEPFIHTGKIRSMASVYIRWGSQLLLLFRQGDSIVQNLWIGSAGGHFEATEIGDARACVLRELYEELSLSENSLKNLSLRYITLRYTDGELRLNYYFFADLKDPPPVEFISNEGVLKWFYPHEINDLPMPFTAQHMIRHYLDEGQFNNSLYAGIANKQDFPFIKL